MKNSESQIPNSKEVTAKASFVRMSPRKLRLVSRAVSGMSPEKAISSLKMAGKAAARPILTVMQQAVANAKNNFQLSPGDLTVKTLQIQEGPRGGKKMDKGHGARFDRGIRRKRMAHILIKLAVKEK